MNWLASVLGGHPAATAVLWSALALLGYTLVGYGVALRAMVRLRSRPARKRPIRPVVSIVVVAHNEGDRIAEKIENLLALDYPKDRMEIVIASDGSTDDTVLRARAYSPRVRVIPFGGRRGKPAVLNAVIPGCRGTVVVLADTRQRFDAAALSCLVRAFADPTVGAVSGELILLEEQDEQTAIGGAASFYWDREKRIRHAESELDSTIGATGAIYAVRRDLYSAIPDDTILDDVLIPMRIVRLGYRVLFEPEARAYDYRAVSTRQEFVRKVRTIAGNFQLFGRETWLLNPVRNRVWAQTVSHKALRLTLPILFVAAIAANCWLLDSWFYRGTLVGELAMLAVAAITSVLPAIRQRIPGAVLPYTTCFLCLATVVGFFRYMTGRQQVTWDRSTRAVDMR